MPERIARSPARPSYLYAFKDVGRIRATLDDSVLVLVAAKGANARRARGELRIEVRDPQGAAVPTEAELVSDANQ